MLVVPMSTETTAAAPDLAALADRLGALTVRDERRLRRQLDRTRGDRDGDRASALARLEADVVAAEARVAQRQASVPTPRYPANLPITDRRDELVEALRTEQVLIVAGETGSGKSTQLPKLCLEAGRGVRGLIGHTQPRRIAARTVAERVAEEIGAPIGDLIGYTVRFTDRVGDRTLVKVMTDGILLAEIQRDPHLAAYDTIIVDEAHERSLNIDFILGYLRQLLPRRPDLHVVVTSATIDTARFSRHFDDAPIIEVSGRTYPVEVRYRPLVDVADPDDPEAGETIRDQTQAIVEAVDELRAEGPGDILVFCSGEREIRDTADALRAQELPNTEILPLYARLSAAEQHRVFEPHAGRRVVLATNVAETSLTVPGVRYVVDPGTARISRYNRRTKVQRLPIEAISQASANQRAGRCGRVAPGVCIRLYAEDDFVTRPAFTEPEILRTNLASVILQMAALNLGDIASFPFVEPPDRRNINDGIQLLEELGALDEEHAHTKRWLTKTGRRLAQVPIDPRLGRMLLEADRLGCVREVLVIASALSIQDPRERPTGKEGAAAEKHRRFREEGSDFLSFLTLWEYLRSQQRELSSSQFRKLCRTEYLNYLRVREWQDLHAQLRQVCKTLDIRPLQEPARPDEIHQAILSGLLSHVGMWDPERREYVGARNARFAIANGSALSKKSPKWVMAAELVETNRMWARVVARIQPEWTERLGAHLVKHSYHEAHWDRDRASTTALETVTLFGLPVVKGRRVDVARIDPELARTLFIRHALVEGDWTTHHGFVRHNTAEIEAVHALERRLRRNDLLVDDEALVAFFDARLPDDVSTGRRFDAWWKRTREKTPQLLDMDRSVLLDPALGPIDISGFPDEWVAGPHRLPLTYRFEPGTETDGVTVAIPLPLLDQLESARFDWHVAGLRHELVVTLLKTLPKQVRRDVGPAPDFARTFLATASPADGPLVDVLDRAVRRHTGVAVPLGSWRPELLPPHLRLRFAVSDEAGTVIATDRDLDELRRRLRGRLRATFSSAAAELERTGVRRWDFGDLPPTVETIVAGHPVRAYPTLVDTGNDVAIRLYSDEADADVAHWAGTRRLLRLTVPSPTRVLDRILTNDAKLSLAAVGYRSVSSLRDDCVVAAIDRLLDAEGGPVWDEAAFERLRAAVAAGVEKVAVDVARTVLDLVRVAGSVRARIEALPRSKALAESVADVEEQLLRLVHPGFVTEAGAARLPDVLRYLRAIDRRLDRLPFDPQRDRQLMEQVRRLESAFDELLDVLPPGRLALEADEVRWQLEELRVSLFAQTLGTARPVSDVRLRRAIEDLRAAAVDHG